jgi:hypothetical protein
MFLTERVASELLGLQRIGCGWIRSGKASRLAYPEFRNISFLGALVVNLSHGLGAQSEDMSFLGEKLCVLH